jgi:hypothetical protein
VLFYRRRGDDTRRMNATRNTRHETPDPSGIAVSNHALLRVYQRLGIIEGARERVRELLADAVPVDDDERFPNCRAYRRGGVTIVVDDTDDVVKTVVKEVGE